jgi:DNA-directed RNA polymerase subunit RPC12/RpoP
MYVPALNDVVSFNGGEGTVIAFFGENAARMIIGWVRGVDVPSTFCSFMLDHSVLKKGGDWKAVPDVDRYSRGTWLQAIDVQGIAIKSPFASSVVMKSSGCACNRCGEFYPWAEPNQENGTLVCWNCRSHRFYRGVV